MARGKQREMLFTAEGLTPTGETRHFSVYEERGSFYIVGQNGAGTGLYQHLCHPSVKNSEGIKREIALVFNVKVTSTKPPWAQATDDSEGQGGSQT